MKNRHVFFTDLDGGGDGFVDLVPDMPVVETPPAPVAPQFDPATMSSEMRAMIARDYAASNPNEFVPASMLEQARAAAVQPASVTPGSPRPDPNAYVTYEEYFKARDNWEDANRAKGADPQEIARQVMQHLAPSLAPVWAQTAASGFPAEIQPYVQQVFAENPAWAQNSNDPAVRRFVTLAAKGLAADAGAGTPVMAPARPGGVPTSRPGMTGAVRIPAAANAVLDQHEAFRQSSGLPPMTNAEKIALIGEIEAQP